MECCYHGSLKVVPVLSTVISGNVHPVIGGDDGVSVVIMLDTPTNTRF